MYFASRTEAGQQLAKELEKYRFENTAILALSNGGVVIGAQIAAMLHCPLMFLLMQDIKLPGENSVLGVVDQNGGFTYNDMFSAGELEGLTQEFHGFIEQQKIQKWHELNRLLSDGGLVDGNILKDRNIILVSDGLINGMSLDSAVQFLKPVRINRLIVATPLASVSAVDKMHLLADELHVLSVYDGTFELDHYYEKNDVPDQEAIVRTLNEAILHWK
jgi:putative phosphoribosyl transferase